MRQALEISSQVSQIRCVGPKPQRQKSPSRQFRTKSAKTNPNGYQPRQRIHPDGAVHQLDSESTTAASLQDHLAHECDQFAAGNVDRQTSQPLQSWHIQHDDLSGLAVRRSAIRPNATAPVDDFDGRQATSFPPHSNGRLRSHRGPWQKQKVQGRRATALRLEYLCKYRQRPSHPHGQSVVLARDGGTGLLSSTAVFQTPQNLLASASAIVGSVCLPSLCKFLLSARQALNLDMTTVGHLAEGILASMRRNSPGQPCADAADAADANTMVIEPRTRCFMKELHTQSAQDMAA